MDKKQGYGLHQHYTREFKIQVCKEHIIDSGVSLRSLGIKYQLSSHSLIHEWLRRYKSPLVGVPSPTTTLK